MQAQILCATADGYAELTVQTRSVEVHSRLQKREAELKAILEETRQKIRALIDSTPGSVA